MPPAPFAAHSAALARRRSALATRDDRGFTLIELLVVVIIIGILAAIAIPVYLGVQNNSKDAAAQSDLGNLKTAAVSIQSSTGSPVVATKASYTAATLTAVLKTAGATMGSNTSTVSFVAGASGAFCVQAVSVTNTSFAATDSLGVTKGSCSATGTYLAAQTTATP